MSESSELERAYRRLISCYPRSFRRDGFAAIVNLFRKQSSAYYQRAAAL
jgi:hypothetical protein